MVTLWRKSTIVNLGPDIIVYLRYRLPSSRGKMNAEGKTLQDLNSARELSKTLVMGAYAEHSSVSLLNTGLFFTASKYKLQEDYQIEKKM